MVSSSESVSDGVMVTPGLSSVAAVSEKRHDAVSFDVAASKSPNPSAVQPRIAGDLPMSDPCVPTGVLCEGGGLHTGCLGMCP